MFCTNKEDKKKMLVVDDSGAMLRLIKAWFEEKYQVILVNSGAMALKYLANNIPEVILLDYEMPVMNGYEVLEKIKTETNAMKVPVIFLTSKEDIENTLKGVSYLPDSYVLKTMEPAKIVAAVEKVLNTGI